LADYSFVPCRRDYVLCGLVKQCSVKAARAGLRPEYSSASRSAVAHCPAPSEVAGRRRFDRHISFRCRRASQGRQGLHIVLGPRYAYVEDRVAESVYAHAEWENILDEGVAGAKQNRLMLGRSIAPVCHGLSDRHRCRCLRVALGKSGTGRSLIPLGLGLASARRAIGFTAAARATMHLRSIVLGTNLRLRLARRSRSCDRCVCGSDHGNLSVTL
jgi:hypothetical protein